MADIPKLRLLVSGTLIEGEQATLEDLPEHERGGAAELIKLFGGPKRVFLLQNPVVYQGNVQVHTGYLVLRSDQVQAGEFVPDEGTPSPSWNQGDFRKGWEE
jgi:hypothetical protein